MQDQVEQSILRMSANTLFNGSLESKPAVSRNNKELMSYHSRHSSRNYLETIESEGVLGNQRCSISFFNKLAPRSSDAIHPTDLMAPYDHPSHCTSDPHVSSQERTCHKQEQNLLKTRPSKPVLIKPKRPLKQTKKNTKKPASQNKLQTAKSRK